MEKNNNNTSLGVIRKWSLAPMYTPTEQVVKTSAGNYLGEKGNQFNLLEFTGNTTKLIFFNPNSIEQLNFVNDYLTSHREKFKLYIREGDCCAIEDMFGQTTLFDPYAKMSSYFEIAAFPAVVEIANNEYHITEFQCSQTNLRK